MPLISDLKKEWYKLSEIDRENPIYQYILLKAGVVTFNEVPFRMPQTSDFVDCAGKEIELIYKYLILLEFKPELGAKYFELSSGLVGGIGLYYTHNYQLENVLLVIRVRQVLMMRVVFWIV